MNLLSTDALSALPQVWSSSTYAVSPLYCPPTGWNRPPPFGLTPFPYQIYSFSLALGLYTSISCWVLHPSCWLDTCTSLELFFCSFIW